jgi:hypothetical protein
MSPTLPYVFAQKTRSCVVSRSKAKLGLSAVGHLVEFELFKLKLKLYPLIFCVLSQFRIKVK